MRLNVARLRFPLILLPGSNIANSSIKTVGVPHPHSTLG